MRRRHDPRVKPGRRLEAVSSYFGGDLTLAPRGTKVRYVRTAKVHLPGGVLLFRLTLPECPREVYRHRLREITQPGAVVGL
jgi:hypothetical protein